MTLEIETADEEPISGRVQVAGEPARAFTGWVDLTRLVEELLEGSGEPLPPA